LREQIFLTIVEAGLVAPILALAGCSRRNAEMSR